MGRGLRKRGSAAFAFRRGMHGRRPSKDWHNFIGVPLIVPMLFVAVAGLTWTKYSGACYDQIKTSLFSAPAAGGADSGAGERRAGLKRSDEHRRDVHASDRGKARA